MPADPSFAYHIDRRVDRQPTKSSDEASTGGRNYQRRLECFANRCWLLTIGSRDASSDMLQHIAAGLPPLLPATRCCALLDLTYMTR